MTRPTIKVYTVFYPTEVSRSVARALVPRLVRCGLLVEAEAKKLLNKGGGRPLKKRAGRPYEYYNRDKHGFVVASQPPAPPHTQTGNLKSSVTTAPTRKNTAIVGPTRIAKYGRIHEFGKRPYMRVALKNVAHKFPAKMGQLPLARTREGQKLNDRMGRWRPD